LENRLGQIADLEVKASATVGGTEFKGLHHLQETEPGNRSSWRRQALANHRHHGRQSAGELVVASQHRAQAQEVEQSIQGHPGQWLYGSCCHGLELFSGAGLLAHRFEVSNDRVNINTLRGTL